MKCFICEGTMNPYFTKKFGAEHQFIRCENCGIVIDETVYNMTDDDWSKLNDTHKEYQGTDENPVDPNWIQRLKTQAKVISALFMYKILKADEHNVDYGCGDGKLSEFINEEYENENSCKLSKYLVGKYDKYMCPENADDYFKDTDMQKRKFDFVLSCSVFEHLIGIEDVNKILSLARDDGIIGVHVLVCETVPRDSEWYYLLPCHCTVWTNRAMTLLYNKYGYVGCAYHVEARIWFFFKDKARFEQLRSTYKYIPGTWVFSNEFVDYWKQKPYRR